MGVARMRYVSRGVFGVVAALAAVVITATAAFAVKPGYHDTVSGAEYSATATEGRFAGYASGGLPGLWNADVVHTPLSGSPVSATITGGSFSIATGGGVVNGAFDKGGTITQLNSGCTQQFRVLDTLSNVGGSTSGKGTFDVTLTHYGYWNGSSCVTFAASVSGTVDLRF